MHTLTWFVYIFINKKKSKAVIPYYFIISYRIKSKLFHLVYLFIKNLKLVLYEQPKKIKHLFYQESIKIKQKQTYFDFLVFLKKVHKYLHSFNQKNPTSFISCIQIRYFLHKKWVEIFTLKSNERKEFPFFTF